MNIYVGNLPNTVNENDLREVFQAFGEVATTSVIKDKFSGESRGFGFIEMPKKRRGRKGHLHAERQGPEGPDGQGQRGQTAHGLIEVRRFRRRPAVLRHPASSGVSNTASRRERLVQPLPFLFRG